MRKIVLALSLAAVASGAAAQTTSYHGSQRLYTTQEILTVLGKPQPRAPKPELIFDAEAHAGMATHLNCGQVAIDFDLRGTINNVKQIPERLASQGTALLNSLPMLLVCYYSPTLCAEIKNLNFRIDEDLKQLSDVCKGVNAFIDTQSTADSVRTAGQQRAFQECVNEARSGNNPTPMADAVRQCNTGKLAMLYTDIAQAWVTDVATRQPQRILQSLLGATKQLTNALNDKQYKFLSSVLGELVIGLNGKLTPVFPARPLTAAAFAKNMNSRAIEVACSETTMNQIVDGHPPTTPDNTKSGMPFAEDHLYEIIQRDITHGDVDDLFTLDPSDLGVACNAVGRSLATLAAASTADDGAATMATAMQNPALPDTVRRVYAERIETTFRALRNQAANGSAEPLPRLKAIIARMAAATRDRRRVEAAAANKGFLDETREFEETPCDSDETCD